MRVMIAYWLLFISNNIKTSLVQAMASITILTQLAFHFLFIIVPRILPFLNSVGQKFIFWSRKIQNFSILRILFRFYSLGFTLGFYGFTLKANIFSLLFALVALGSKERCQGNDIKNFLSSLLDIFWL